MLRATVDTGTDVGKALSSRTIVFILAGLWYHRRLVPDEILGEIVRIGVGRRTESMSWMSMIVRHKGGCWMASLVHKHKSTDIGRTLVSSPTSLFSLIIQMKFLKSDYVLE